MCLAGSRLHGAGLRVIARAAENLARAVQRLG
jgi:hypothetical protein